MHVAVRIAGFLLVLALSTASFAVAAPTDDSATSRKTIAELKKDAETGVITAMLALGNMYFLGDGVPQDYEEAAKWTRMAAEKGAPDAQLVLGTMYLTGHGVGNKPNPQEAARWLTLAARENSYPAMYSLGNMYQQGIGVPKDLKQSLTYFKKAADGGHARSQTMMGIIYAQGAGVPKDNEKSLDWLFKAADQGDPEALYIVGFRHYTGDGLPKDNTRAYQLLYLAALQGYGDAFQLLQVVSNDMTPEQIKKAEAEVAMPGNQ